MYAARAVSPARPDDRFELAYVDSVGEPQRGPLSSCWNFPFERAGAVRQFTSRRGQRSFSGLWYFASSGEHVGHESWLERDRLMLLDADPDVVAVSSQPFWLCWEDEDGRSVRHAPDYFVRRRDGTAVVLDVRADDRIAPKDAAKFATTAEACESVGWEFERVGAPDAVYAANLRWLAGYRHRRYHQHECVDQVLRAFVRPFRLMDGARGVGDPLGVLPVLFHLLWRHELRADLRSAPLSENTLVWAAGDLR